MFRLPDCLTGDNLRLNRLKLLQTWQPLCCFFVKNVCLAQPKGGQVVCCAGPMRVNTTDCWLCCTIWDGAIWFPVRRYRGNISNSAAHCTWLIHRACTGNDLTARGFGNYLWDATLLRKDLPLSERYSDRRYSQRQVMLVRNTMNLFYLAGLFRNFMKMQQNGCAFQRGTVDRNLFTMCLHDGLTQA